VRKVAASPGCPKWSRNVILNLFLISFSRSGNCLFSLSLSLSLSLFPYEAMLIVRYETDGQAAQKIRNALPYSASVPNASDRRRCGPDLCSYPFALASSLFTLWSHVFGDLPIWLFCLEWGALWELDNAFWVQRNFTVEDGTCPKGVVMILSVILRIVSY
jgi:hypothetical protein